MKLSKFIQNYFPDAEIDTFSEISFLEKIDLPQKNNLTSIILWPPNTFIILYSLIEYSDKYRLMVSPQDHFEWKNEYIQQARDIAQAWAKYLEHAINHENNKDIFFNAVLHNTLNNVFNVKNFNESIYDLFEQNNFTRSVFMLVIAIDEVFSDINICSFKFESALGGYLILRNWMLSKKKSTGFFLPQNLADNHGKYGFVTYKSSVPQSGLTINNLTHHLTCIKPAIKPLVRTSRHNTNTFSKKHYNILFLPWPMAVQVSNFKESSSANHLEMDSYFGFFDYKPDNEILIKDFLSAVISAMRRCGSIDLIVMPESTLNDDMFNKLKKTLFRCFGSKSPSILSGTYGNDGVYSKNSAKFAFIGPTNGFDEFEQKKHHRWFLDKNQLRNYNLASALDPNKKWWENIKIERRHLSILHTENGIRLCPLICEDLARQEPVAQAVRAIGPNLVISLLLDGPQLKERWPGKYSAVLSDDPGTSVLSVTALGMSLRSTGLGDPPNRGVALWSEPNRGSETLHLKDDGIGLVLELELNDEKMWTIDGRAKEKSVLRKINHSTIFSEFTELSYKEIKKLLVKELAKGV